MHPTAAGSPDLNLVTAEPTLVTRSMISWPRTQGYTVASLRSTHYGDEIRMADAAEENFYLYAVFGGIPTWDGG